MFALFVWVDDDKVGELLPEGLCEDGKKGKEKKKKKIYNSEQTGRQSPSITHPPNHKRVH